MSIPGAIRFNTDSMKLEYYRGGPVGFGTTTTTGEWVNLTTDSPDIQTGGARGLRMGGNASSNVIEYYNIDTTGNAIDFGDLTAGSRKGNASVASRTRGITAGGEFAPGNLNTIEYITIASTGDSTNFGDLTSWTPAMSTGFSNSTRGIFNGGYGATPAPFGSTNIMQYITITSTGDAVDFGDSAHSHTNAGSCSSSTRGIVAGGSSPPTYVNNISFSTISTLGNGADFGDLTSSRRTVVGGSNSVRGIFAGGQTVAPNTAANGTNIIDYITIASLGNAIDFGDLTQGTTDGKRILMSPGCSPTRCVWPGGTDAGGTQDATMEYVQIASTGNAINFGECADSVGRYGPGGCSNGHGGLG
jgi:hypothetical protein